MKLIRIRISLNVSISTPLQKLFSASGHLAKRISPVSQQRAEGTNAIEGNVHNRKRFEQIHSVSRDSRKKLFAQSSMQADDRHTRTECSPEN